MPQPTCQRGKCLSIWVWESKRRKNLSAGWPNACHYILQSRLALDMQDSDRISKVHCRTLNLTKRRLATSRKWRRAKEIPSRFRHCHLWVKFLALNPRFLALDETKCSSCLEGHLLPQAIDYMQRKFQIVPAIATVIGISGTRSKISTAPCVVVSKEFSSTDSS